MMQAAKVKRPAQERILVVALTGGIASGKSTVSDLFKTFDVPVIDTDVISRQLVEPGQPLLGKLVAAFGPDIVGPAGRLKRRKLRSLIFSSPQQRLRLEEIMHPAILDEARRQISTVSFPYCLLVIPLLTEIGGFPDADRVLVVDAPVSRQFERLTARDKVSKEQAESAVSAQASRERRLEIADDVIDNSGDEAALRPQVEALHQKYMKLGGKS